MIIQTLIRKYNLKVADVVVLVSPGTSFPKHYAFYMGIYKGRHSFLANTAEGVRVICGKELEKFMNQYEVLEVETYCTTDRQRYLVIRRAMSRLGESEYHLIFNNCEHFKNWVLEGNSRSDQVRKVAAGLFITGLTMTAVGYATKKKGLQKAGLILMLSPLIIVLFAMLIVSVKKS